MGRLKYSAVQRVALFWSKVKVGDAGECWPWLGGTFDKGYGAFRYDDATHSAHRFSATLAFGDIPAGMVVCHHCDNPPCVNPAHLFLGTYGDNMQDATVKGRMAQGERSHKARLNESDVRAIRSSPLTHAKLARIYGVDPSNIAFIRARKTWKHVA